MDDDLPTDAEDAPRHRADVDDARLKPGTEVADTGYVIDEEIGKGGMGHVYSATHRMIGKRAAIKVLRPDVSRSPIVVERFIQEARAVNQIHHPNIIDIFAFGALDDGRAYHIMDLLIGESLRKRLKRGPLHPSEAASVIEETASALTAAHEKGFIHRDLKPDNIFLQARDGRWPEVKLLDFGLAKLMPEAGFSPFKTKTGVMLGTPEYMSPEQARGTGVDYRTDLYALGVMMFEILSGRRPFVSQGDAFATLMMHAEEPPPSLHDYVPNLPLEMVQLVDSMLSKEPDARPSLAAVRAVIKRVRATKLPGHSMVLELSVQRSPVPEAAIQSKLDISESRVGAEALMPHEVESPPAPAKVDRRISRPPIATPPALSQPKLEEPRQSGLAVPTAAPNAPTSLQEPAYPGIDAAPPPMVAPPTPNSPSLPPTPLAALQSGGKSMPPTPLAVIPSSIPPTPAAAIPGYGSVPPTPAAALPGYGSIPPTPAAALPGYGSLPPMPAAAGSGHDVSPNPNALSSLPPQSLHPPAASTHGGRSSAPAKAAALARAPLPNTELGVAPAPRSQSSAVARPTSAPSSRLWIIIGACVAIAVGVGIAIILVGT